MMLHRRRALALLLLGAPMATGACAPGPVARTQTGGPEALAAALAALGPGVAPQEARRAAAVSYAETARLARAYRITDPPLVHNGLVNAGLRPRGLCWHWAEDMQARLDSENFATLVTHRAIANADRPFRIEHSTAILSARGARFDEGIVIDPWRLGGTLTWVPVGADPRYVWEARAVVLARKAAVRRR